jgi:hypothetical protein
MTPEEIKTHYWEGKIDGDKIRWTHSNASEFFRKHGIEMNDVYPHVESATLRGPCGTCDAKTAYDVTTRSKAVAILQSLNSGGGRCHECYAKEKADIAVKKAAEAKAFAERAAQKVVELETYRRSLELKHGIMLTNALCPSCEDGFLIVRLNANMMSPFLSCSRYNPYRNTCRHSQPLAMEFWEKYMLIFRERMLEATEVVP